MSLLQVKKLTIRFGGLTAVEDVTCTVNREQVFSIIGPNGAGKTTVFNAITGIYEPTEGTIEFEGRPLVRQLTWKVLVGCGLIGLLTGLTAALVSIDVNALWRATIKRNYAGPGADFSYRAAWNDVGNYLAGRLALEPMRGNQFAVRTADGRTTLGYAGSREEGEKERARLQAMIAVAAHVQRSDDAGADSPISQRDGKWIVRDLDSGEELASFPSQAEMDAILDRYAAVNEEAAARRRRAVVSLLAGALIGAAGAWTVWSRARRTPEVISRAGIARTFQNIRLFQNMTVLDNVLVGMDRRLKGGVVRMALQLPGIRAQEYAARAQAGKLLDFVGLGGRESMLAKNLPYGDQRRLEIARALATEPRLVLLDEPAAGMNPAESLELNGLIEQMRGQGLAVLLIEHHMKVVMGISDRIAVLEYGVKIAEGTPEQVRKDPRVIAAYLGSEEVS